MNLCSNPDSGLLSAKKDWEEITEDTFKKSLKILH
jgi:hypothetical protein